MNFLAQNCLFINLRQKLHELGEMAGFGKMLHEHLGRHSRRDGEGAALTAQFVDVELGNQHLAEGCNLIGDKASGNGFDEQIPQCRVQIDHLYASRGSAH